MQDNLWFQDNPSFCHTLTKEGAQDTVPGPTDHEIQVMTDLLLMNHYLRLSRKKNVQGLLLEILKVIKEIADIPFWSPSKCQGCVWLLPTPTCHPSIPIPANLEQRRAARSGAGSDPLDTGPVLGAQS